MTTPEIEPTDGVTVEVAVCVGVGVGVAAVTASTVARESMTPTSRPREHFKFGNSLVVIVGVETDLIL